MTYRRINKDQASDSESQSSSRSKSMSESFPIDCFTPFIDCLTPCPPIEIVFEFPSEGIGCTLVLMLYPIDFLRLIDWWTGFPKFFDSFKSGSLFSVIAAIDLLTPPDV